MGLFKGIAFHCISLEAQLNLKILESCPHCVLTDLEVFCGQIVELLQSSTLLTICACVHESEPSNLHEFKELVILCSCLTWGFKSLDTGMPGK